MHLLRILTLASVSALAACGTEEQAPQSDTGTPDTTIDGGGDTTAPDVDDTGSPDITDDTDTADLPPDSADVAPDSDVGPIPCAEPSPAGCISTGCPDGESCVQAGECVPSSCLCVEETGTWACTDDCSGGICVAEPACAQDSECTAPQVCEEGTCTEIECPTMYEPVCGVNEVTYPNACVARIDHVEVARLGACTDDGCESDADCPFGVAICERMDCVACPLPTVCEGCPEGYVPLERNGCTTCDCAPVRECETSNDCDPDEVCRGVGICTDLCIAGDPACCDASVCEPAPTACEGPNPAGCSSTGCPDGLVCDPTVGCAPSACGCDAASGAWTCTADCSGGTCVESEGRACTVDRDCAVGDLCAEGVCASWACTAIYDPVCGADGRTYGNACEARLAHVDVAHEGECARPCADTSECDRGEICNPDSQRCQPPCDSIACLIADPVCGSDGRTYTCGAYEAACNGATVVHEGPCRE